MSVETLNPEVAAEQAAVILKDQPLSVYGKTNFLIDWESEDVASLGKLREALMGKGHQNTGFWKVLFTPGDYLDELDIYGKGFMTVTKRNQDKDDPDQYAKQFEARYIHNASVKRKLPSDKQTDILFIDTEKNYVEYLYTPTILNLADPRFSRQGLRVMFSDPTTMHLYLNLVLPQLSRNPSFIFSHVMPKLFPRAFKPVLDTVGDRELIDKVFDEYSLYSYIRRNMLANVLDWSKIGTVLPHQMSWDGIFKTLKTWGREYYEKQMPIISLLRQTIQALQLPFDQEYTGAQLEQQLHSDKVNSILKSVVQRLKAKPRPYLERVKYAATIKRAAPAESITVYNAVTGELQTPQLALVKLNLQ